MDMDEWEDGNKDGWSGKMNCAFAFKKAKLWAISAPRR